MKTTTATSVSTRVATTPAETELARALAGVLADTYSVYLLTQNYHWNVEGPNFPEYHKLLNDQYDALAAAVDEVAEAIRAMGHYAPGTFAEFQKLANVRQSTDHPDAAEMLRRLAEAHGGVLARIGQALPLSEGEGFDWVNDLLIQRQEAHNKMRWMLQATLGGPSRAL